MKIKKTYAEIKNLEQIANNFLLKEGYIDKRGYTNKPNTKLVAALKSLNKQILKINEDINDDLDSIRSKHAAKDPKTNAILKESDLINYQFTHEGLVACKAEIKEYMQKTTELQQRIIPDFDENLNDFELEAFSEVVIPKQEID